MNKTKILGISIAIALFLTSFVMAETYTSTNGKKIETEKCLQPPAVQWNRTYGGSNDEILRHVQQTNDGGYIATGVWNSQSHWLLKVDANGNQQWNVSILPKPNLWPRAYVVQQTLDGGYITGGCHEDNAGFGYDRCLWKVDATGTTEWLNIYTDPPNGYHKCIQETSDSGYIITGEIDVAPGNSDVLLMKTNSLGILEWQKIWSYGESWDSAYAVRQTTDGGYIIAGYTQLSDTNTDFLVIKTDSRGNKQWDKTYGGEGYEFTQSHDILLTSDEGYLFVAQTKSFGAGKFDLWIVKTDAQGNKKCNETFGDKTNDIGTGADFADDGGYVFLGIYNINGMMHNRGDGWIIKTDEDCNVQWSQRLGGKREDETQCVAKTSDGGYILSGNTESFGARSIDGWLIKIAPDIDMETPEMTMKKPKAGWLYFFNILGIPFPFTQNAIVLGDLTFIVDATDSNGISQVEFVIDNNVVETVEEAPYTYEWTSAEAGMYTLKIRAYNTYGGTCKEEVMLHKIF